MKKWFALVLVGLAYLSDPVDGQQKQQPWSQITDAYMKDKEITWGENFGDFTGIEFQGLANLPIPFGPNGWWEATVELDPQSAATCLFFTTAWNQPWTVAGVQAWSMHAYAYETDGTIWWPIDFPQGTYTFRAKVTAWVGFQTVTIWSATFQVTVTYI